MPRTRHLPILLAAATLTPGVVVAQIAPASTDFYPKAPGLGQGYDSPRRFHRVDQGVADVGPLSTSLQHLKTHVDLRRESGFERVYRDDASGRFFRFDGAIGASFPRSSYVATRDGVFPTIPAGTVFHIGAHAPADAAAEQRDPAKPGHAPGREDARESNLLSRREMPERESTMQPRGSLAEPDREPQADASQDRAISHPTVATNEAYRRQRLAQLIRAAAQREPSDPR